VTERIVFARESAVLHDAQGLPWSIRAGQPWRADDPLVAHHPSAFADEPEEKHVGSTRPGRSTLDVEQASRAPGERRLGRGSVR
jgi:hypothetical protein